MSIAKLNEMERLEQSRLHPNFPKEYLVVTKFSDKTANGLANCVTRFIELWNGFSTRMSVEGRVIMDGMGNAKRIPSSNLKGSADTTGCFLSVRLEVEIKIGSDRMKPDQIKFKERIENADGFYMEVKTFDDFYNQFDKFIHGLPEHFIKMHTKSLEVVKRWEAIQ